MKLYNLNEVSEILRVSTNTAKTLLKENKLQGTKVGREWRISENNLNEFLSIKESKEQPQQEQQEHYKDIDIDSYNLIELIKSITDYQSIEELKNKIIILAKEFNYNPSNRNIDRIIERFF